MRYTQSPDGRRFVRILDISAWQTDYLGSGKIRAGALAPDFHKAAEQGIAGIFARIGNGTTLDQSFDLFYHPAKDAGLAFGAYYYAQPNRLRPSEAAELVAGWAEPYDLDPCHMLDLEHYWGADLAPEILDLWCKQWLNAIEVLDKRRPIVYSGAWFVESRLPPESLAAWDTMQSRYPRGTVTPPGADDWHAWIPWSREPRPTNRLGPWEGWQFSSSAHWPDYGGQPDAAVNRLDVNLVAVDAWERWTMPRPSDPITPPPDPQEFSTMTTTSTEWEDVPKLVFDEFVNAGEIFDITPEGGGQTAILNIECWNALNANGEPDTGHLRAWGPGGLPKYATADADRGEGTPNQVQVRMDKGTVHCWVSASMNVRVHLVGVHRAAG